MPFYSYILKSLKDNGFYFGSTEDLDRRLKYHNSGKVRSTKHRRPLVLHYCEKYDSKSAAISRELFFKSVKGRIGLEAREIV